MKADNFERFVIYLELISRLAWVCLVGGVGSLEIYAAGDGICENEPWEEGERPRGT